MTKPTERYTYAELTGNVHVTFTWTDAVFQGDEGQRAIDLAEYALPDIYEEVANKEGYKAEGAVVDFVFERCTFDGCDMFVTSLRKTHYFCREIAFLSCSITKSQLISSRSQPPHVVLMHGNRCVYSSEGLSSTALEYAARPYRKKGAKIPVPVGWPYLDVQVFDDLVSDSPGFHSLIIKPGGEPFPYAGEVDEE
jgi:hypothetical protein